MVVIIANYNNNLANTVVHQTAFDKVCYVRKLYEIYIADKDLDVDESGRVPKASQKDFTDWAEAKLAVTGQKLEEAVGTKKSNVRIIVGTAMDTSNEGFAYAKELCKHEVRYPFM